MYELALDGWLPHRAVRVSQPLIAREQCCPARCAVGVEPRIVKGRAQAKAIELVEFTGRKHLVFQVAGAIVGVETNAQGVLRSIRRVACVSTLDANAGVDLKTLFSARENQLD